MIELMDHYPYFQVPVWELPDNGQRGRMCFLPRDWRNSTCKSLAMDDPGYANHLTPSCITQHLGFMHVCINKWMLKTAWYQYKQQYTDSYEGPEHKQFRHIAYHQLARWCWGFLGKDVCAVLPSCAVMCIRAHFPPPGLEEDFFFRDSISQMNDETHNY